MPVQCHGIAKPMIMKMPSITGTSSRGNVLRKNSGPTLARSSDPRQPGAYEVLRALVDPFFDPPFEELFADDAGLCDGLAERCVGRLAG